MFDLRYHVASLAAVFLALIVGILVGVALSNPDLVEQTELDLQQEQIARLNEQLDDARSRVDQQRAAESFVDAAYDAVMSDRLAGRQIVVVFVGSVKRGPGLNSAVERALADAGADVVRLRALTVPVDAEALQSRLAGRPALAGYLGEDHLSDLGRDLGRELVEGGETPLWDVLAGDLVAERRGPAQPEADGVVVLRSSGPQAGDSARFLSGLYDG
ncbi:MAG: copper transporter, partial [Gaiellaceae bacterium]